MYAIIIEGELRSLCDSPRYVRRKPETGVFIQCKREDAEGIAVDGEVYNLMGGNAIPDRPEAFVREAESSEYVFRNRVRIIENEESTGAAIIAMEDALCEIDAVNAASIAALEDALCEIDAGGASNE